MSAPNRTAHRPPLLSSTLVGSIILILGIVGVTLAYNANKGLPFVPTYDITVEVPDAARVVEAGSEVRIGGSRVGIVDSIEAVRPGDGRPPFARIGLALDIAQEGLAADTRVTIRPRSLLGAKYVALVPGRSRERLPAGSTLPLRQAIPVVEVSDTFDIFGKRSARALQAAIIRLGNGFAGRGTQLNEATAATREALPALGSVLRTLTDPATDLGGFVAATADLTGKLAPRTAQFASLLDGAATTFAALDRSGAALPDAITELARTAGTGIRANRRLQPVLADAAAIARDLRPATAVLPRATRRIGTALGATTPGLRRVPELRAPLSGTLAAVDRLTAEPATASALRRLTTTVRTVRSIAGVLLPAQQHCNVIGLFARNTGGTLSKGDDQGHWLSFLLLLGEEATQTPALRPQAHVNPLPREDATECESGNEPFRPGQQTLGNPEGVQDGVPETRPPAEATARARRAGLLEVAR